MATYAKGKYECEVIAQGFSESKEKKTPFFFLEFIPKGKIGDDGYVDECTENWPRTVNLWISEKAIPYTIEKLRELGFTGGSFADLEGVDPVFSFVGKKMDIECDHQQDGEKVYDKWNFPRAGGDGAPTMKSEQGLARKLDSLWGKELRKDAAKPAPKPIAAGSVVQGDGSDVEDDIPF